MNRIRALCSCALLIAAITTVNAKPVIEMQATNPVVDSSFGSSVCTAGNGAYFLVGGSVNDSIVVSKVNHDGSTLWLKQYYISGWEAISSCICPTFDNGCLLVGLQAGFNTFFNSIIRIDSVGNSVFTESFSVGHSTTVTSLIQTADSGFVLTGYVNPNGASYSNLNEVFLAKMSASGSILWTWTFGDGGDVGKAVRALPDGSLVIAGETSSYSHFGAMDIFLMKTDSLGNVLGYKTYGGPIDQHVYSFDLTSDKGFVLSGETNSFSSNESYDGFILKVDSLGNYQGYKTFSGYYYAQSGQRCAFGVVQTDDGGYVICGSDRNPGTDSLAAVLKLDSLFNQQWLQRLSGTMGVGSPCLMKEPLGRYTIANLLPAGNAALTRIYDDAVIFPVTVSAGDLR